MAKERAREGEDYILEAGSHGADLTSDVPFPYESQLLSWGGDKDPGVEPLVKDGEEQEYHQGQLQQQRRHLYWDVFLAHWHFYALHLFPSPLYAHQSLNGPEVATFGEHLMEVPSRALCTEATDDLFSNEPTRERLLVSDGCIFLPLDPYLEPLTTRRAQAKMVPNEDH